MTSSSPSRTSWVRRRGATVAVALLSVTVIAIAACRRSSSVSRGSPSDTHTSPASAVGWTDDWMNKWYKETFDGQDSRKLWGQFSQAATAELSKPGADPSDLTAKANALGANPDKVFEFIRDQITLEPYAGVLRGPRGTLAAAAGNALDRALLAKDLLRLNGIDSRLVTGRLSEAQADTLLSRFVSSSQVPTVLADLTATPDDAARKEQTAEFARAYGISEQAAARLADHMRDEARGFWAKADAQSATQFDSLAHRLRQTSLKMAVDAGALTAKLKERLRDHYWLQVREPNGAWSAFDAAFPDPRRGTAHASHPVALSDAPDSLYHKLVFTLVYQTMTDGAPKEDTVVAGTYPSADALFQSIQFHIQPSDLDPNAFLAMDVKTKAETLRNVKRFQGLLIGGGRVTAGRKFDFEGNTYDATSGPMLKPAGGTFADALGGAESAVRFSELRVVIRLTGPGRDPMVQSRTLVRGSDLAAGSVASPMLEWDILLQPQWIPSEFVAFRALHQVIEAGDALSKASKEAWPLANVRRANSASPFTLQASLLREAAIARILARRNDVRAFVDEPMLTIAAHDIVGIDEEAGGISGTRSFDIVANGVRYVPISDTAAAAAFDAALRQGVADCTLEDRILRESFPSAVTKSGMTVVEQASLDKRPVLLAKVQDIDALRSTGVTEADIEWIHDNELPDSRLVVATTAAGSDAWWSVRPDGTALLRTNGGRGQALTEYLATTTDLIWVAVCLKETWKLGRQILETGSAHQGSGAAVLVCLTSMLGGHLAIAGMGHMAGHAGLLMETWFVSVDVFLHFFTDAAYESGSE